MASEVYMDIPQVEKLATSFMAFHEILNGVAKVLEALSRSLQAAAWISFGATAAAAAYIERIKPNVQKASNKMEELSKDIRSAINAYQRGDYSGSRRFC